MKTVGFKFSRGSRYLNMALIRTGRLILKSVKPTLSSPFLIPPSSVNLQVRFAARKGYRDKKRAILAAKKSTATAATGKNIRGTSVKIEKTLDLKKPPPPEDDDVFISHIFNYKKYTLSEAVLLHREYHHPEIYNNPKAPVTVRIEINMTGKKSTQVIKPFKGIVSIPHPFVITHKREVLVLCDPEHVELALASGASTAGGVEMVQKIKEGVIQLSLYEYVIAHQNFLSKLTPIRSVLRDQLPRQKLGTLTNDLPAAIYRFLHGIEYNCTRGHSDDFGFMECHIGLLDMELNQLEENLKALVEGIETNRPPREGEFVSWIWCTCKPSPEKFAIDISNYATTIGEDDDFDEDDQTIKLSNTQLKKQRLEAKRELEESAEL